MQPEAVIIYERVLNGERWPYKYIGTITTKERTTEILRYLFFEKLGIRDYEEAKAVLDRTFIKDYKLFPVIRSIPKPPELLPNEYDHVLWLIFPERKKGEHALVLKVYSEVLSGKRKHFPHGYFTDAQNGRYRAEICVKHMCRKLLHYSGDRIAREFCDSSGIKTLAKSERQKRKIPNAAGIGPFKAFRNQRGRFSSGKGRINTAAFAAVHSVLEVST